MLSHDRQVEINTYLLTISGYERMNEIAYFSVR